MPSTKLVFYQETTGNAPVLVWLDELKSVNLPAWVNCLARIKMLAEKGRELRRPAVDYLRDGIYELRCKHIRVQFRILFSYFGRDRIVLLQAFRKNSDLVDPKYIDFAIQRVRKFKSAPHYHSYIGEL